MTDVLLFHHVLGRTAGVERFADRLRDGGHTVHVPDLFDGHRFASIDEGLAHVEEVGFEEVVQRGVAAAEDLSTDLVYAGMSLGVMPAQWLAQRRPGARGVLLYHGGVPLSLYGGSWPVGLPVQAHVMADDELGDVDVLESFVPAVGGELHLYEGDAHLFTDDTTDDHDPAATTLVVTRSLTFLAAVSGDGAGGTSGGDA